MSQIRSIPSNLHPLIDLRDLKANNKLLSEEEITFIQQVLAKEQSQVFSRTKLNELIDVYLTQNEMKNENHYPSFRISKIKKRDAQDEYFAIYKGVKWGKALGIGHSGNNKVKIVQKLNGEKAGKLFALKVLRHLDELEASHEFMILSQLKRTESDNILKKSGTAQTQKIIDKQKISYIITDLALGKNLYSLFEEQFNKMDTSEWLKICLDIAWALRQIHNHDILHRDIKLQNIVYDQKTGILKFVDFGLARAFDLSGAPLVITNLLSGTKDYIAPELKEQHRDGGFCYYNDKTEVYAMGICFSALLGFKNVIPQDQRLGSHIINKKAQSDLEDVALVQDLAKLISLMTAPKPENRPYLAKVIEKLTYIKNLYQLSNKSYSTYCLKTQKPRFFRPPPLRGIAKPIEQLKEKNELSHIKQRTFP